MEKMEAQLHNRRHYEEDDPHEKTQHSEVIGDDHGEKKSVLDKVKDQAKKIKETIKKRDEDMAIPSEVHQGAVPMYESPVIPDTNLPTQTDVNLEKPTDRNEACPLVGNEGVVPASGPVKMVTELGRSSVEAQFENPPELADTALVARISPLAGLEDDTKVTDTIGEGGKEAYVAPLLQRLDNFHVHDPSKPDHASEQESHTGSHDQFAAQSNSTTCQFIPELNFETLKNSDQTKSDQPMPGDTIIGKISSAMSAVADKAVSAKDTVASKLGYIDVSSDKKPELAAERLSEGRGSGKGGDSDTVEVAKGMERGVSVKEYLVEKLRPGEEDKALSDAIRKRFHKKNVHAVGSDEVVARLGMERGSKGGGEDGGRGRSEGGVVGRLKGAVGSWFGESSGGPGGSESKEEIGSQQQLRIQESGNY